MHVTCYPPMYIQKNHIAENSLNTTWDGVCHILKQNVSSYEFERYFKSANLLHLTNGVASISVSSEHQRDQLMMVFGSLLRTSFSDVLGEKTDIAVILEKRALRESGLDKHVRMSAGTLSSYGTGSGLSGRYRFDRFVEMEGNKIALRAAKHAAENPQRSQFSPLFFFGDVGLGKTHLMQAIGHSLLAERPTARIHYGTSEQFLSGFVLSIRNNSLEGFKSHFSSLDALLIDDVQFLSGKTRTQEELFHVFENVHQRGGMIVLTADVSPAKLNGIHESLRNRFVGGLSVHLDPPQYKERVEFLKVFSERQGLFLFDGVLEYLAHAVVDNIRLLEGAVVTLKAYQEAGYEVELDLVSQLYPRQTVNRRVIPSMERILEAVSEVVNIPSDVIVGPGRKKHLVTARLFLVFLIKRWTNATLESIGYFVGGRNHSTIVKATQRASEKYSTDFAFKSTLKEIERRLGVREI